MQVTSLGYRSSYKIRMGASVNSKHFFQLASYVTARERYDFSDEVGNGKEELKLT
ncbi:hypothetical protein [Leptospira adleri]|uniref:hypothetical protein n=1 Tax=Leptospira adleri TaxID=2023186 RepID=UPI0014384FDD|nr:hypothetical protein [Leptospira adleri]